MRLARRCMMLLAAVLVARDAPAICTAPDPRYLFDDFTGSSLDTTLWTAVTRQGDPTNSEDVCYTPGQVSVAGGNMTITSAAITTSCGDSTHTAANHTIRSAWMYSKQTFLYGTFELKGTWGMTQGAWPAFWLLGANCQPGIDLNAESTSPTCSWPNAGSDEIDIAELTNGSATAVKNNIFKSGSSFGNCVATITNSNTNSHTYTLVWALNSLTWKIDGVTTCTASGSANVPNTPMFVIVNNAAGGSGGGTITTSGFPVTSVIEYVRVTP